MLTWLIISEIIQ